jgi:hypothetical protein
VYLEVSGGYEVANQDASHSEGTFPAPPKLVRAGVFTGLNSRAGNARAGFHAAAQIIR